MPLTFAPMQPAPPRAQSIFVSASIPDPERWDGEFDALEITDAVVSLARTFLTAGFRLVTAAHPTIAPLLLYVAAEFPSAATERVAIYQSELFTDVLPAATRRFEAEGVGRLEHTDLVALVVDQANLGHANALVDPCRVALRRAPVEPAGNRH